MIAVELAWLLLFVAALSAWRWSKSIAAALLLVFAMRLLYLHTHWEPLRWVAIVPGLAGVYELGRRGRARLIVAHRSFADTRARDVASRKYPGEYMEIAREILRSRRVDYLGLACVASMAADGTALIVHRAGLPWSLQYVQAAALAGVVGLCTWPERRASC